MTMSVINVDQLLARATHSRPYLEAGAQDPLQNTIEATGETVSFDPNEEIYAEEDLSRFIGDAPAHTLGKIGRGMAEALKNFVSKLPGQDKGGA